MTYIPNELWAEIIDNLDDIDSIIKLSQVCRQLREIVSSDYISETTICNIFSKWNDHTIIEKKFSYISQLFMMHLHKETKTCDDIYVFLLLHGGSSDGVIVKSEGITGDRLNVIRDTMRCYTWGDDIDYDIYMEKVTPECRYIAWVRPHYEIKIQSFLSLGDATFWIRKNMSCDDGFCFDIYELNP